MRPSTIPRVWTTASPGSSIVETAVVPADGPSPSLISVNYALGLFGREEAVTLLRRAELYSGAGPLPERVTKVALWHMIVDNIHRNNDEGLGVTEVRLSRWTMANVYGAFNQMDTLGDGLRRFPELAALVPSGIDVTVTHGARGVHVNFLPQEGCEDLGRQERYIEGIAVGLLCVLIWVSGEDIRPIETRLSGTLPDEEGSLLSRLAEREIRSGPGVTLVFDRAHLDMPLGVRKYRAWCEHETHVFLQLIVMLDVDSARPSSRLVDELTRLAEVGPIDQGEAARRLAMSVSTMRRRLLEKGTSFREISQKVRMRRLMMRLATDDNLDDIASELGFSDRRSLARSCQAWLGVSPSVYRLNRRNAD